MLGSFSGAAFCASWNSVPPESQIGHFRLGGIALVRRSLGEIRLRGALLFQESHALIKVLLHAGEFGFLFFLLFYLGGGSGILLFENFLEVQVNGRSFRAGVHFGGYVKWLFTCGGCNDNGVFASSAD